MATTLARVLIVGKDRETLEARRAILDHFWAIDLFAIEGTAQENETWPPEKLTDDVVILCTSIPQSEQQGWIDRIRQPSPNILLIRINGFESGPHAGADATVDELHGPGALVSTLYALLTERGLGSRAWPISGNSPRLH